MNGATHCSASTPKGSDKATMLLLQRCRREHAATKPVGTQITVFNSRTVLFDHSALPGIAVVHEQ